MFKIKDWMGNICFEDQEFDHFETAWEFLSDAVGDDELDEYEVFEVQDDSDEES